jgi:hypothetical protein
MAVITTYYSTQQGHIQTIRSADAQPADSVELYLSEITLSHTFMGIKMFDSGGNVIPESTETGTFVVYLVSDVTGHEEAPINNSQNAAGLTQIDFAGPIREVKVQVTIALSAGVDHWRVELMTYKT